MKNDNKENTINLKLFLNNKNVDVYPITILKYLLNEQKIKFCLKLIRERLFEGQLCPIDKENCLFCKKNKIGICRQHTSIDRILNIGKHSVLKDVSTGIFFYKNEIFKCIDDKLVIIYCPHTRLIDGKLTTEKIKKIYPITIINDKELFNESKIVEVDLSFLFETQIECWFNKDYTIKLVPKLYSKLMDIILTLNN